MLTIENVIMIEYVIIRTVQNQPKFYICVTHVNNKLRTQII